MSNFTVTKLQFTVFWCIMFQYSSSTCAMELAILYKKQLFRNISNLWNYGCFNFGNV